ncbi:RNA polymerase sigma factor [Sporomusa ovata DSM 2662]|uniref:RNA polymerase sigma factor 70 region 4 type 2 domain-containing protein n=1 Tax=Sporomusa ovata TaxID=2378 RepID=A0A0U1L5P2_9FIRM|nr:sigma-70 family RNA polymerase sigma factor [Sporomusa ovata]EQB24652.1 RNA polymerase sigma factor, sigma-70 family [Sporomusa ovata DSM 2662]CQR74997.1 hypothetical protein SpAn4DRAFT_4361 [Sporomusa ovata]
MKIKYEFVTGETVEIEVEENIGEVMAQIDRDIYRSNRRETNKHNSVEALEDKGIQLADESMDIPFFIEQQEMREALHNAMDKLLPQQRELIQKVFFTGKSISEIARAEGVDESSIRDRLKRIYKKLKNFSK